MKLLLCALFMFSGLSAFAGDLEWQIADKDCHVEVLEDLYILHSTVEVQTGSARLTANTINRNVNRRLAAGRKFFVRGASEDKIQFRDGTVRNLCIFASNNGMCLFIRNLDVEDIETFSNGMLRMECVERGTVDA